MLPLTASRWLFRAFLNLSLSTVPSLPAAFLPRKWTGPDTPPGQPLRPRALREDCIHQERFKGTGGIVGCRLDITVIAGHAWSTEVITLCDLCIIIRRQYHPYPVNFSILCLQCVFLLLGFRCCSPVLFSFLLPFFCSFLPFILSIYIGLTPSRTIPPTISRSRSTLKDLSPCAALWLFLVIVTLFKTSVRVRSPSLA